MKIILVLILVLVLVLILAAAMAAVPSSPVKGGKLLITPVAASVSAPPTNITITVTITGYYALLQCTNIGGAWQWCTNITFAPAVVTVPAMSPQMFFRGCWRTDPGALITTNAP